MMTTMNKPLTLMGRGSVLEGLEQLLVRFLVFFFSFPLFDLILYFFYIPFSFFFFFDVIFYYFHHPTSFPGLFNFLFLFST